MVQPIHWKYRNHDFINTRVSTESYEKKARDRQVKRYSRTIPLESPLFPVWAAPRSGVFCERTETTARVALHKSPLFMLFITNRVGLRWRLCLPSPSRSKPWRMTRLSQPSLRGLILLWRQVVAAVVGEDPVTRARRPASCLPRPWQADNWSYYPRRGGSLVKSGPRRADDDLIERVQPRTKAPSNVTNSPRVPRPQDARLKGIPSASQHVQVGWGRGISSWIPRPGDMKILTK